MLRSLLMLLSLVLLCSPAGVADDDGPPCADRALKVGFYAFFEPISYSADADPDSPDFDTQRGYEADLLTGLEAMDGAGLRFTRRAIAIWDEVWLRSAMPDYDLVGGGITNLDSRRFDAAGAEQIAFTDSHITFRQSVLVRAEDAERLHSYAALTSDVLVGAVPNTTGESRLLEITGLTDEQGTLLAGTQIETPEGIVTADGSSDFVITAADESDNLAGRTRLLPPDDSRPQVVYLGVELGESELIEALYAGDIDAIARGAKSAMGWRPRNRLANWSSACWTSRLNMAASAWILLRQTCWLA